MQSIGVVFKKDEMVLVALKQGIADYQLEGYRILPFLDLKDEEREQSILHNIERFVQAYKGGRDNIFVTLPRDMALVQFLQMPAAAEENLGQTLGFEIDRYTPFVYDDVYFDWHVTGRQPEGGMITVMLVTIKRTIVDQYLDLFAKLDLRPQAVEISTTALCNAFFKYQGALERLQDGAWLRESGIINDRMLGYIEKASPKAAGFLRGEPSQEPEVRSISVLVDFFDSSTCELAVLANNALCHSQVLALQPPGSQVTQLEEIQDAGRKALIYLPAAVQEGTLPLHFQLSGREMPRDLLDTAPEAESETFSISRTLPVQYGKFSEESFSETLPVLFMPSAAAVRGLRGTTFDINLIPANRRPRRKKSKRKLVAAAALIAVLAVLSSFTANRNMAMEKRLTVLTAEVNGLRKKAQKIEDQLAEAERREKFIKAMKAIRGDDVSKLLLLEELTRLVPNDSWLTEFKYKAEEKKARISGFAVSAAKLIPILEESPLFDSVKFSTVITTDRRSGKERFRIEMQLSGSADKEDKADKE